MNETIDLPKIICGKIIYPTEETNNIILKYTNGFQVRIPALNDNDVNQILNNREKLSNLPLSEVATYLSNAGSQMIDPNNSFLKEACQFGSCLTGYNYKMFQRDYFIIGEYTLNRNVLYDLLDAELGDYKMLDEWVRNQVARVKAFPRGRAYHVMVGNVPLASMYSIVRSILTKNQTIIKVPSRDPVTSIYYAMTLINANKGKELLNNSISAFYFDKDSPYMDIFLNSSDIICAWGKGQSLQELKKRIPHSIPYLELGPKRSFSVLFEEDCKLETAALRFAHDMSIYDQEACFSPQRLFVVGCPNKFISLLKKYLEIQAQALPKGIASIDSASYLERVKMEAIYRDWEIHSSNDWTIIVCKPDVVLDHPLGRTIFIHPILKLEEITEYIDDETQAISIFPYDKAQIVGEMACSQGAQRICEFGQLSYPREGFTHDGMYPLNMFVRLCYLDESVKYIYKYARKSDVCDYLNFVYGTPSIDNFEEVLFEDSIKW